MNILNQQKHEPKYATIKVSDQFDRDVSVLIGNEKTQLFLGVQLPRKYQVVEFAVHLTAERIRKGLDLRPIM